MKVIGVIPARYHASRLPGKLLKKIGDKSIIVHSYQNILKMNLLDELYVATDHDAIAAELNHINAPVIMTSTHHQSGTDRIAEAVEKVDGEVIINIQGDEPFVDYQGMKSLVEAFRNHKLEINVASLMTPINDLAEIENPNNVKVICNKNNEAIYFSRSVIPYKRDNAIDFQYYKHVGVYAYKKQALLDFVHLPISKLEQVEKLEQLRFLENNMKIHMFETSQPSIGIDTEADLEQAKLYYQKHV